ncbi:MAG: hypothetical protein RL199_667 [Pseudomonadota bacterium]|jgi:cysteine-rich repeat protein
MDGALTIDFLHAVMGLMTRSKPLIAALSGLLFAAACSAGHPPGSRSGVEETSSTSQAATSSLFTCPWGEGECTWTDATGVSDTVGFSVKDTSTQHREVAARFVAQGAGYLSLVAFRADRTADSKGTLYVEVNADGTNPTASGVTVAKGKLQVDGAGDAGLCVAGSSGCFGDGMLRWLKLELQAPVTRLVAGQGYWVRVYGALEPLSGRPLDVVVRGVSASDVPAAALTVRTVTCATDVAAGKSTACKTYVTATSASDQSELDLAFLPVMTASAPPSCIDGIRNGGEPFTDRGEVCGVPVPRGKACFSTADCRDTDACRPAGGMPSTADCRAGGCACRARLADRSPCEEDLDCKSNRCRTMVDGSKACEPAGCGTTNAAGDKKLDSKLAETDVDCGGAVCGVQRRCGAAKKCVLGSDCGLSPSGEAMGCLGGSCRAVGLTDACSLSTQCPAGLVCPKGGLTANRCVPGYAAGAACSAAGDCASRQCSTTTKLCLAVNLAPGEGCQVAAQCASKICGSNKKCAAPGKDGVMNGTESGVDCGGTSTARCAMNVGCDPTRAVSDCAAGLTCSSAGKCLTATGLACTKDSGCASGVCYRDPLKKTLSCLAGPTCSDGKQNGDETGVDCGGSCAGAAGAPNGGRCDTGLVCEVNEDCLSLVCGAGQTCSAASCKDGVRNGAEQGVDCGGGRCAACPPGTPLPALKPTDSPDVALGVASKACSSGVAVKQRDTEAEPEVWRCAVATCSDGVVNGLESDRSCDGLSECGRGCSPCPTCTPPTLDRKCTDPADCASGKCSKGRCIAPTSTDLLKNGAETDIDCGGSSSATPRCGLGKACLAGSDCKSGDVCLARSGPPCTGTAGNCTPQAPGKCSPRTCVDNVPNGAETDVDCGGKACGTRCTDRSICAVDADCASRDCVLPTGAGVARCAPATRFDKRLDGDETDIDCGTVGPDPVPSASTTPAPSTAARCVSGQRCDSPGDCSSGLCEAGVCTNGLCGNQQNTTCGRLCSLACISGQSCRGDIDCLSGFCFDGVCSRIGCNIGGLRVPHLGVNPQNPCLVCDAVRDPTSWSSKADPALSESQRFCDDGDGHTFSDRCVPAGPGVIARCAGTPTACKGFAEGSNCPIEPIPDGAPCQSDKDCAQSSMECVTGLNRCQWKPVAGLRTEQCRPTSAGTASGCVAFAFTNCGNGRLDDGEACDDGNLDPADDCTNDCQPASCGDGIVGFNRSSPEECDLAAANNDSGVCTSACQLARCGDAHRLTSLDVPSGRIVPGLASLSLEDCDDGNRSDTDACLNSCDLPFCGDGKVQDGVEQCDDANARNDDACVSCLLAVCGDGRLHFGVEQCDDGNRVDSDACNNACVRPGCGDGVRQPAEECDDGNSDNTDDCSNLCTHHCGDGVTSSDEACDDGNSSESDDCLNDCSVAVCGDAKLLSNPADPTRLEQCDVASDPVNCTPLCKTGVCGDGFITGSELCDDKLGPGCKSCKPDGLCNGFSCADKPHSQCLLADGAPSCACLTSNGFREPLAGEPTDACVDVQAPKLLGSLLDVRGDPNAPKGLFVSWGPDLASDNDKVAGWVLLSADTQDALPACADLGSATPVVGSKGRPHTGSSYFHANDSTALRWYRACAVDPSGNLSATGLDGSGKPPALPAVDCSTVACPTGFIYDGGRCVTTTP